VSVKNKIETELQDNTSNVVIDPNDVISTDLKSEH